MGVVYQAFDTKHGRNVALKTLLNESDGETLEAFRRELVVLSHISHPNIVDVYDSGEMEEGGRLKPYFVMPFLRGQTLQELIAGSSQALTVDRVADILIQTAKGLQAAHESGLIHRDLKPSNIFILEDFSVNIIDFGVAHLVDRNTTMGLKGTLPYMAPEQVERKPLSPSADIFSLGVVGWEALTRRRPFEGATERDVVEAIVHHVPPLVSELNPAISQAIALVIHKAMAKHPAHRFPKALDMAECLQKALRNEPIEYFNPERIRPRLLRARKAASEGDDEFAREILSSLEAEGFSSPEISALGQDIEREARQKDIRRLLETAKRRFSEEECQIALQKLQEILELEPENAEAIALKEQIEKKQPVEPLVQKDAAPVEQKTAEAKPEPPPVAPPAPSLTKKRRGRSRTFNMPSRRVLIYAASGLVALLLLAGTWSFLSIGSPTVRSEPRGAVIQMDGKPVDSSLELKPGTYNMVARLPGYHLFKAPITVERGGPPEVVLRLTPLPTVFDVSADFDSGTVSLDREPVGEFTGGKYSLRDFQPGVHSVTVAQIGLGQATLRFKVAPGQPPAIVVGPTARGLDAVAISAYRGKGRLFTTFGDSRVTMDGKNVGELNAGVLELPSIEPGHREFIIGEGPGAQKLAVQLTDAPTLRFLLVSDGGPDARAFATGLRSASPSGRTGDFRVPGQNSPQNGSAHAGRGPVRPAGAVRLQDRSRQEFERPADPPPRVDLAVSQEFIRIGDQIPAGIIVSWSAIGAKQVRIEPQAKFDQTPHGQCRLYPAQTVTIRLIAESSGGTVSKEVRIEVDDTFFKMPLSFANRRCEPVSR